MSSKPDATVRANVRIEGNVAAMLQGILDRDLAIWATIKALPCESDVDNCHRHKQEGNETNPKMRGRFGLHPGTKEGNCKKTGEHDGDRKSKVTPCFGAALLKLRYGIHCASRRSMRPRNSCGSSGNHAPTPELCTLRRIKAGGTGTTGTG